MRCVNGKSQENITIIQDYCGLLQPFNSHKWPRQNFPLQYQYNIKQTSDENKEKLQLGDY